MESVNEVVTKLYAVRAGMCVLASEKQKSDDITARAQSEHEAKLRAAEERLQVAQSKLNDAEEYFDEKEERENSAKNSRNRLPLDFIKALAWTLLSLFLIALLLAFAGATLYFLTIVLGSLINYLFHLDSGWMEVAYGWYGYFLASIPEGWMYAIFFLAPLVCGGLTAVLGYLMYKWFIDDKQISDNVGSAWHNFRRSFGYLFSAGRYSKQRRRAERSAENARYSFNSAEESYNKEVQKADSELDEEKRKANAIISNAMVFYSALEKLYGDFLNPRDWKYVDYMIYTFETGRAESMKESLQLADREEQTQRIVDTMQEATRRICETIKDNADRIQHSLQQNFDRISEMVAEESAKICGYIGSVEAKVDRLDSKVDRIDTKVTNIQITQGVHTAYLARISSRQNIANEFMKHQSESSSQLATNVSLLRDDYRRVNSLC